MRVAPPASPLLALALPAQAPGALAAPDTVQFRQALEPTPAGRVSIPIDRNRIATVVVDETIGPEQVPSVTTERHREPGFVLRCVDPAAARSMFHGSPPRDRRCSTGSGVTLLERGTKSVARTRLLRPDLFCYAAAEAI